MRPLRKLAFLTDAPHFGGAERYLIDMASAAVRREIQPVIAWCRPADADPDIFASAGTAGLEVLTIQPDQARTAGGFITTLRALFREHEPDGLIINACGRLRFWMSPWVARFASIPSVWVHQMVDGRDHRRLAPRRMSGRMEGPGWWRIPQTVRHRLAAAAASSVVALNAADRDLISRWQRVPRDHIRVIPHGIDIHRFTPDPVRRAATRGAWGFTDADFIIGTAGRLVQGKRVDLLIDAAAVLHDEHPRLAVVIAGTGPERDSLIRLARHRNIAHRVRFLDFTDDMPAFHNGLDAFALCSDTESFGLVIAEAMACGRPVVATPTAGARRQIHHEVNGLLLEGWDAVLLADALRRLAVDAPLRQRLGRAGRDDVIRDFSIDLTLERTLRALRGSTGRRAALHWPHMDDEVFASMPAEDPA